VRFYFEKVIEGGVKDVFAGFRRSFVIKQDGSLWAAGNNKWGELGDGTRKNSNVFKKVMDCCVATVDGGAYFSLVLKEDGSLWATGKNWYGQFGDGSGLDGKGKGTNMHVSNFVKVIDSGVKNFAAGYYHTMVVKQDGSLWGAGYNSNGQIGDGERNTKVFTFKKIIDSGVKEVYATTMGKSTYVLKQDGTFWATGENGWGQIGNGDTVQQLNFIQITSGVKKGAAGISYAIVEKNDGSMESWGGNTYGQLGLGLHYGDHKKPQKVPPLDIQQNFAGPEY